MMPTLAVVAPTWLEYMAARVTLHNATIRRSGIGAMRVSEESDETIVICGLAGALTRDLRPGTVVIPDRVATETGHLHACDAQLVAAMNAGARTAGLDPRGGNMLTASRIITGDERDPWAERGFCAVDMETAVVAFRTARFAAVRVILDTPSSDLSAEWLHAGRAVLSPVLWSQMLWLVRHAPKYALRAARAVERGLREIDP